MSEEKMMRLGQVSRKLNVGKDTIISYLANKGFEKAIADDPGLAEGVNTYAGKLTYEAVATSQDLEYTPLSSLVGDDAAASA